MPVLLVTLIASVVLLLSPCPAQGGTTTIAVYAAEPSPLMNATADSYTNWVGLEADIIRHLCDGGYLDECSFVRVYDLPARLQVLQNGTADMSVGAIIMTPNRLEEIPFILPPYYSSGLGLFVDNKGYTVNIVTVDDISNAVEAVRNNKCIAFAYDSFYAIPGLTELPLVFKDTQLPYGIAIVSILIDGLSKGPDSFLLKSQAQAKETFNTLDNPALANVTSIISYQSPLDDKFESPLNDHDGNDGEATSNPTPTPESGIERISSTSSLCIGWMTMMMTTSLCQHHAFFVLFE